MEVKSLLFFNYSKILCYYLSVLEKDACQGDSGKKIKNIS